MKSSRIIADEVLVQARNAGDWRGFTDGELLGAALAFRDWRMNGQGPIADLIAALKAAPDLETDGDPYWRSAAVEEAMSFLFEGDHDAEWFVQARLTTASFPLGDGRAIAQARDIGAQVLSVGAGHGVSIFPTEPDARHGLVFDEDGQLQMQRQPVSVAYPYLADFLGATTTASPAASDLVDALTVNGDRYLVSKGDFLNPGKHKIAMRTLEGNRVADVAGRPDELAVVIHRSNIAAVRDIEIQNGMVAAFEAPWAQPIISAEQKLTESWSDLWSHAADLERRFTELLGAAPWSLDGQPVNRPLIVAGVKVDCLTAGPAGSEVKIGTEQHGYITVAVRDGMEEGVRGALLTSARRALQAAPAPGTAPLRVKAYSWPLQGEERCLVGIYDSLGDAVLEARPAFDGAPLWFKDEAGTRLGDMRGEEPIWTPAGRARLAEEATAAAALEPEPETPAP